MHTNLTYFIFLLLPILGRQSITAQPLTPSDSTIVSNPKIGLVLSGGGALGLAHIGVLKVLEEKGIRPDFVVGTSMGSIVGGLYALGYTPEEIEEFVVNADWEEILAKNIPLNFVVTEEKYDYGRYLIDFPFKNGKPKLPSGLIEGQLLTEALIEYTWSGTNYSSFDEFPIPFRCVGTDVSNGNEIIFKDGSLALAMRSSMAIPTVFTPVGLDSTLVVDGGVVNNFPVDIAQEMGADYIIGVNVTSGFKNAHDIDNMVGILYQIAMLPSNEKLEEHIKLTDVYIHPDVSNFSASDFKKAIEIIATGEDMARKNINLFDSLINVANYSSQPVVRKVIPPVDSIFVSQINYHSANPKKNDFHLFEKLEREPNNILNLKSYKTDTRFLYGTLKYKNINYWAHPDTLNSTIDTTKYVLDVHIEESPRTNLKFGIHYDNTFGFGLIANFSTINFLIPNSRIRWITDLSENFKTEFEFLKYLGKKQNFAFLTNYKFLSLEQPTYLKGQLDGFSQNNISIFETKIQTNTLLNKTFSLGYQYLYDRTTSKLGNDLFQNFKVKNGFHIAFVQYQQNTLNRNYHPTKGQSLIVRGDLNFFNHLKVAYPSGEDNYEFIIDSDTIKISEAEFNELISSHFLPSDPYASVIIKYQQIIPISSKINLITDVNGGITLGQNDETKIYRAFNVGGNVNMFYYDFKLHGLRYAEDLTNNVAILAANFQYRPSSKLLLYAGANTAFFSNSGFRINSFASDLQTFTANELLGYGISAAYLSPVGPIEFGTSWNTEDPYTRWNVQIGFQF
ncbi:MAG: patatin-like phospholipase family protein [Salibacteraceae bacterium]